MPHGPNALEHPEASPRDRPHEWFVLGPNGAIVSTPMPLALREHLHKRELRPATLSEVPEYLVAIPAFVATGDCPFHGSASLVKGTEYQEDFPVSYTHLRAHETGRNL